MGTATHGQATAAEVQEIRTTMGAWGLANLQRDGLGTSFAAVRAVRTA